MSSKVLDHVKPGVVTGDDVQKIFEIAKENNFAMPALLTPEQAAQDILAGFCTGHFEIHFPKRFTRTMKLLALLPYAWSFPLIRRFTGA